MITSMTGFAHATVSVPGANGTPVNVTLSLKALNTRFFEATCKLPESLSYLETKLIKLLKQGLRRGHVILSIRPGAADIAPGIVHISLPIMESYVNALRAVQKKLDLPGQVDIEQAARCQAAFGVEGREADEKIKEHLLQAVQELINQVHEVRQQEGTQLQKDIEQRCALMQQEISTIEKTSHKLIEKQKEAITQITREMETADDVQGLEIKRASLYSVLEKMDINEEVVRFKTHLQSLQEFVASDKPEKGKRIDFLVQELGREINTIAAKCSSAVISTHAINVKVELEKIREQAQNIV